MYYYIFDIKKFSKRSQVEDIKNYLNTLGISGEFTFPTAAQNIRELVDLAIGKKYSTIIAVGGEEIVNEVAGKLVGRNEAMGIIPHNDSDTLSQIIGSKSWKDACDILRYRKINQVRLGRTATLKHFLTFAKLNISGPVDITLEFKDFMVQTKAKSLIISNLHPQVRKIGDDYLDVLFESVDSKESIMNRLGKLFGAAKTNDDLSRSLIRARSLRIFTKNQIPISTNNVVIAKTPQLIESTDEYLRIITARNSSFWHSS